MNFAEIKLREKNSFIILEISIPGFKEKDIEINLSEDSIDVSAEKKKEKIAKGKDYFSGQWASNRFSGSIDLPSRVIPGLIHHEYDGKVLKIKLTKK